MSSLPFSFLLFFLICLVLNLPMSVGAKKEKATKTTVADEEGRGTAEPEPEEPEELDLSVFSKENGYVEKIESELRNLTGQKKIAKARSLLSLLGKIAFFQRLFRLWITSPDTGHRGFDNYFPQPPVRFNNHVYFNCNGTAKGNANENETANSTSFFFNCVESIFENIQQRAKFMFPLKNQRASYVYNNKTTEEWRLDEEDFVRQVSNSRFSYDISVSYLFCYLTKVRLSVLAKLPFCGYGVENRQSQRWPAGPFRRFKDSLEIKHGLKDDDDDDELDPLDTLSGHYRDFECADVSFCPDPCCGRKSKRFFRDDEIKGKRSLGSYGYCNASACAMNVKHLDERLAELHFKNKAEEDRIREKKQKEEEEKKKMDGGVEDDGDDEEGREDTEEEEDDDEEKEEKEEEQGNSSEVNTHYCYLDSPFNEDFIAIMENRWNLSCACAFPDGSVDESKIYRFDVLQCVDLDECLYKKCPDGEQCLNMVDGGLCVCPLGHYRDPKSNNCIPVPIMDSELKNILELI